MTSQAGHIPLRTTPYSHSFPTSPFHFDLYLTYNHVRNQQSLLLVGPAAMVPQLSGADSHRIPPVVSKGYQPKGEYKTINGLKTCWSNSSAYSWDFSNKT